MGAVLETPAETAALQGLLDRSLSTSTEHLRSIITEDHVLTAADLVALLTGMKVLTVATVTAHGEPRISADTVRLTVVRGNQRREVSVRLQAGAQ